jgi:hypothetical protein
VGSSHQGGRGNWLRRPPKRVTFDLNGKRGLSRRVEKVVGYPPLAEMDDTQRCEFQEALLEAATFEDLSGKWQAAILKAEQNRPKLRLINSD